MLVIYLLGVTSGLITSKYVYRYDVDIAASNLIESYNLVELSKTEIQKQFLHFYINDYCDPDTSRVISINMTGVIWDGLYCDKDSVMVLSDSFPPLPIAVMNVDMNTGE